VEAPALLLFQQRRAGHTKGQPGVLSETRHVTGSGRR
jgi:hypothetical protein